jgi:hypothetical protein
VIGLVRPVEFGFLEEDGFFEAGKLGVGGEAEFVPELVGEFLVGVKRVGLAAGSVQGHHELGPEALAGWVGTGGGAELVDECDVPA